MGTAIKHTCSPRQLRRLILRAMAAGLVPFVQGPPGVGKSEIVRGIAAQYGLKVIDHRLSTSVPEDLTGLPDFSTDPETGVKIASFAPFARLFPIKGQSVPEGFKGWLLFLDEFNSASKEVQAAAYKLILDRMLGQHELHEKVVIVCAGNQVDDNAIVTELSTAMQSRLVHLVLKESFDEWLEDVALPRKYSPWIVGFLHYKRSYLMDFRPDHDDKTFCCPRTWDFTNRLIKTMPAPPIDPATGKTKLHKDTGLPLTKADVLPEDIALYSGTISSGVAGEFVAYVGLESKLIKIQDVEKDPMGTPLPHDAQLLWATVTHLLHHLTDANFPAVASYVNRFPTMEFRVLFYRSLKANHAHLKDHPAYAGAVGAILRHLNEPLPSAILADAA